MASLGRNISADGFATLMETKAGKTDLVYCLAVCQKYLSTSDCSDRSFMRGAGFIKRKNSISPSTLPPLIDTNSMTNMMQHRIKEAMEMQREIIVIQVPLA